MLDCSVPSNLLRALVHDAGPSLVTLSLVRPRFRTGPDHYIHIVECTFSTLRNLTYAGTSEILTTLSKASNLEHLTLNTVSFSPRNGGSVGLFGALSALPKLRSLSLSIDTDTSWLKAEDIMAYIGAQKTLRTLTVFVQKSCREKSPWCRWSQTEKDEVYHLATSAGVAFSIKSWE